jgi:YVTN family beta-propeller protein
MRQRSGSRVLAAVLFTDIVDSSAVASRVGDARWKELIARHHAIVRRELKRFGGRELDTAGDGFYASFGEPAAAIRCACAAAESVRELGIEIRAGVHFGECEQLKEKLGGIAVVVGARVMSLGGAGDVLVTASTSSLVAGAGFGFTDRGEHSLKGVDGQWHVLAVSEVDGEARPQAAEREEAERRLADVQPSALRLRTWRLMAIAAAFLVVVAVVAVPPLARRGNAGSEIAPNSVGVLDPSSGELSQTIAMPSGPGAITAANGSLWVTNPDVATVIRIDEKKKALVDTIPVGVAPAGIAAGEDAIWVVESGGPTVSRISTSTNAAVGDPIGVGNGPAGIAVGEGAVWVTNRLDGTVSKIDPDRGEAGGVVETIAVGFDPSGIAVGFGSVWVALAGSNKVVRVDPETNEVTDTIDVGNAPGSLVVSPDAVWVVNSNADTVSRIDHETNLETEAIPVGDGPSGIVFAEGAVWVANGSDGTLSRIDPGSTAVDPAVRVGSIPQGLATAAGSLWVSVRGTATNHRGGTLKLDSVNTPATLDPGVAYDYATWTILVIEGDGLVGFKRVGGEGGVSLVPDLAVSVPTPSDGGRAYRFVLRSGIRYSNGEVVAPADFRRAIEREFALKIEIPGKDVRPGADYFGGLVGGEACSREPDTCDLSHGIEADDDANAITFNLAKPDPEFLQKLATPLGFPVPESTPDEEQIRAGVPGTGPYRLEGPMTGEGLVLVRNEHFTQWSAEAQPDGNVDRIEWTFGGTPEGQAAAVANGEADYMGVPFDPVPRQIEDLRVRFAGQVYEHPTLSLFYLSLNTKLPPFNEADVRRALNLAVDRRKIVDLYGGPAAARLTCQILPPNYPGYEPYCPYTIEPGPGGQWSGPDMEGAKHLVRRSGTAGTHVTFWYTPAWPSAAKAEAQYFVEVLKELGFVADLRSTARTITKHFVALRDPGRRIQIAPAGWLSDYPSPSNFIATLVGCDLFPNPNYGAFCDRDIDTMIEHAALIPTEDPAAYSRAWAEVDHAITDQAPFVSLVNPIDFDFVSERLGNYQYNPVWGLLLAQVWVR